MSLVSDSAPPPSLFDITVRRATVSGRFFLVYGSVMSAGLGLALAITSPHSFVVAFPVLLPIFGVMGSMGGLVVFTNDRQKGVLEYLLSYGVSPRRLFANVLFTSLALVTIVLAVALGVGLGVYLGRANPLTVELVALLAVYAVPMTYACAAFAATIGMFWTTLSSPRQGMNSPVGLAPFLGILPSIVTLGVLVALGSKGGISTTVFVSVAVGATATVALVVALLLSLTGRFLRRERLLSPA